jgi:hypothetical protein
MGSKNVLGVGRRVQWARRLNDGGTVVVSSPSSETIVGVLADRTALVDGWTYAKLVRYWTCFKGGEWTSEFSRDEILNPPGFVQWVPKTELIPAPSQRRIEKEARKAMKITVSHHNQNPRNNRTIECQDMSEAISELYSYTDDAKDTGVTTLKIEGGSFRGKTYAARRWSTKRAEWSK